MDSGDLRGLVMSDSPLNLCGECVEPQVSMIEAGLVLRTPAVASTAEMLLRRCPWGARKDTKRSGPGVPAWRMAVTATSGMPSRAAATLRCSHRQAGCGQVSSDSGLRSSRIRCHTCRGGPRRHRVRASPPCPTCGTPSTALPPIAEQPCQRIVGVTPSDAGFTDSPIVTVSMSDARCSVTASATLIPLSGHACRMAWREKRTKDSLC